MLLLLLLSTQLFCLFQEAAPQQPPALEYGRLCVLAGTEKEKPCQQLAKDSRNLLTCTYVRDRLDCLKKLTAGTADFGYFEAEDVRIAARYLHDNYEARLEFVSDSAPTMMLALVRGGVDTVSSFCHPGAYWSSALFAAFPWSAACLPGYWSHDPAIDRRLKLNNPHLCQLCVDKKCLSEEPYGGDSLGSLQCLLRNIANVSFITEVNFKVALKQYPEVKDMELLCPDFTRRPLSEAKECNWGMRPRPVLLNPACHDDPNCSSRRQARVKTLQELTHLTKVVLDLDDTTTFSLLREAVSPAHILKKAGLALSGTGSEDDTPVRLCVTTQAGLDKCRDLQWALSAFTMGMNRGWGVGVAGPGVLDNNTMSLVLGGGVGVACVLDSNNTHCVADIYLGKADVITLDSGDVYKVHKDYGFERLLTEVYASEGDTNTSSSSSYYSVAVVRATSNITTFHHLKGRISCHTGIDKTSGWKLPVATLLAAGVIKHGNCDFVGSVAEFFSRGSCAPGGRDPKYNPSQHYVDRLCKFCIGEGENKCARSDQEPFYSYRGAFRCLIHGGGEVAFVKHSTPISFTDGHSDLPWTAGLRSENFRLLCGDGGTGPLSSYSTCNLALVPAHEVVVSGRTTEGRRSQIRQTLLAVSHLFRPGGPGSHTFRLFGENEGRHDLLFSDMTVALKALSEDTAVERDRKKEYFNKLDDLHTCDVRVCALEGQERDCEIMADAMRVNGQQFTCVPARDRLDCIRALVKGRVDMSPLPGSMLGLEPDLRILAFMKSPEDSLEEFRYSGVAVVRRKTIKNLADVSGKTMCTTGYGRTAGWKIPLAMLSHLGVISSTCPTNQTKLEHEMDAITHTFPSACVPGPWTHLQPHLEEELKKTYSSLCAQCEGQDCDPKDSFAGYEGALRCLTENHGSIAFTKLNVVNNFFTGSRSSLIDQFALLCPDGSLLPIRSPDSTRCGWASRPWDVYVVNGASSDEKVQRLTSALISARLKGEENLDQNNWYATTLGVSFNLRELDPVFDPLTTDEYYKKSGMNLVDMNELCREAPVRLCVRTDEEENKCGDLQLVLSHSGVQPPLECVKGTSTSDCLTRVSKNKADIIAVDGGEIYPAIKRLSLSIVASETYGQEGSHYYGVAVIKADSGIKSLKELKGKKSCHTGYGKNAGWRVPIAALLQAGLLSKEAICLDPAVEVARFFNSSCVPGAKTPTYDPHRTNPESLCQLCVGNSLEGDGDYRCVRDARELFSSYTGALRCLVQGGGDVAFVKHTTVSANTDGRNMEPWASHLNSSDFRLLCADGTAAIDGFQKCNLARVPAHAVMTRRDIELTRRQDIQRLLATIGELFGKPNSFFSLFHDYFSKPDLLFKDSTTDLIPASEEDYAAFLAMIRDEECG